MLAVSTTCEASAPPVVSARMSISQGKRSRGGMNRSQMKIFSMESERGSGSIIVYLKPLSKESDMRINRN